MGKHEVRARGVAMHSRCQNHEFRLVRSTLRAPRIDEMGKSLLDVASDYAFERLNDVDGSLAKLPLPLQTVVVVYSAQGVIDNGGLEYFYESDFPNNPPYALFVSAYRRIGAVDAADCIEKSAALFPFPNPHMHRVKRDQFLEKKVSAAFSSLSDRICGDESVWKKLALYVKQNRAAFKI
jgi:hypothetical protein